MFFRGIKEILSRKGFMFPLMIVLVNILKDSGKGNKNVKYCPELVHSFFLQKNYSFLGDRK